MKNQRLSLASENRNRVVRQNRIDLSGEKAVLVIDGVDYDIIDCSPFGVAFRAGNEMKQDAVFSNSEVMFENQKISDVNIKIIRSESSGHFFKVAAEVVGHPLEIEKILAIKHAIAITTQHEAEVLKFSIVPEDFRRLVSDMKVWLLSLKIKVDAIEKEQEFNRQGEKIDFENMVANIIGGYIVKTFEPMYVKLDELLKNEDKDTVALSFDYFRDQMVQILLGAPFHNRAFNKPLGYAGDYQMMNQIYSFEGMGDSLFSKCLHLYFISAPESRAVRNRAEYLYNQIYSKVFPLDNKNKIVKILSVACGPAFEVQNFIKRNLQAVEHTRFYFLDQDIEALQFVQRKIKALERDLKITIAFELIHKPIRDVIAKGLDDKFDLIYSAGLFDYFSDPVASMAAKRLHAALASGGKLIIGNFSNTSLGKITMDIALDWHLIYRSPEELSNLFAPVGQNFRIESEQEGINLFCHIDK